MFSTEKNKLFKLWNNAENNKNIIVTQDSDNSFIIKNINFLNKSYNTMAILGDFSSKWVTPDTYLNEDDEIIINAQEFKLSFINPPEDFIPYIHADIIYRYGTSGIIPTAVDQFIPYETLPFDNLLALSDYEHFGKSEIIQRNETTLNYITYIYMNFTYTESYEIEYKLLCHLMNPYYYS